MVTPANMLTTVLGTFLVLMISSMISKGIILVTIQVCKLLVIVCEIIKSACALLILTLKKSADAGIDAGDMQVTSVEERSTTFQLALPNAFEECKHKPLLKGVEECKHEPHEIKVVRARFKKEGEPGDYLVDITNQIGDKTNLGELTLFVYNDNFSERMADHAGEGNAAARIYGPYGCIGKHGCVRSCGVVAGEHPGKGGGFGELSPGAKLKIDHSLTLIVELLLTGDYNECVVPVGDDGRLGVGVYKDSLGDDVRRYIGMRLLNIAREVEFIRSKRLNIALTSTCY